MIGDPVRLGEDCPACGAAGGPVLFRVDAVPVHDVRVHRSREDAVSCARGDIRLRACPACGLVWNAAFDEGLLDYGTDYESTQAESSTFRRFHARLAADLVERFGLRGGSVAEIGCGRGEFLAALVDAGVSHAVGYDPAAGGALPGAAITIVPEPFGPTTAVESPDLVVCKMTLEHVPDPRALLGAIRDATAGAAVFLQVPDVARILREAAFWDIYYEHCVYYAAGSLGRTVRAAGFEVRDVRRDYGGQYLLLDAHPGVGSPVLPLEESPESLIATVEAFGDRVESLRARWRDVLERLRDAGRDVVVWGGGSKAVAFLGALDADLALVPRVVDVNPRKADTWLPGTGQPVLGPAALADRPPDAVLVLNPVYRDEVADALADIGLCPALATPDDPAPFESLSTA